MMTWSVGFENRDHDKWCVINFFPWSLIWDAADSVIVFKELHAPLGDDDHPHKYEDEDNDDDDVDADHDDVDIVMGPPDSLPLSWALWV